jgi:hypothetical protein
VNRVYKIFELVKETEIERFREKSYFYRKSHGLPLTESNDDLNPDLDLNKNGEMRAHDFEEPEAEEINFDVDKTRDAGRADKRDSRYHRQY